VPEGAVKETAVLPFDEDEALEAFFRKNGKNLAAVLMEPVPANAGLLLQREEYLRRIQELCREHGALLVLDEVISGFRVGPAGAAGLWGLEPDLVTYGKVIGGGMPVGAVAGRAKILESLAPLGPVYQAGTLSGNPVAMAGGAAALRALDIMEDPYGTLEAEGLRVEETIRKEAEGIGGPVTVARIGSLFWIAFQEGPAPRAFHKIDPGGVERYGRFHQALLARGIYFPPSGYEVCFLSTAHAGEPTDRLLEALGPALREAYA
jgi:glutamate-1-semialdehyde 2,1-aminomutase